MCNHELTLESIGQSRYTHLGIEGDDRPLLPAVVHCDPRCAHSVDRGMCFPALLRLHKVGQGAMSDILIESQLRIVVDGLVDGP